MSTKIAVYKTANSQSKSKGILKYVLYVIISGIIAFYAKDSINVWVEEMQIPFRGELLVTFLSIALGMFITTFLLYFYERAVKSGM